MPGFGEHGIRETHTRQPGAGTSEDGALFVSEGEGRGTRYRPASPEAVGMLIWLLDANKLDRRRYSVMNRLRAVRESDQFEALPDALRQKVREVLADSER